MTVISELVIGGYHPASFIDYPGRVAAVVFFQGCNFCCPYCHNAQLIPRERAESYSSSEVLDRLAQQRGKLGGVVLSGGEPTLQPALPKFCVELQAMGYPVKLDTNGSNPDLLATLLDLGLVNYVAMDLKAPRERYREVAGDEVNLDAVLHSVDLIAAGSVEHHFRTTFDQSLLTQKDLELIQQLVPPGSTYLIQTCR